ncbi:MAG: hypothetical protein GY765_17480, partial [bacterium]|nr:hypothetical protein [bacterium]
MEVLILILSEFVAVLPTVALVFGFVVGLFFLVSLSFRLLARKKAPKRKVIAFVSLVLLVLLVVGAFIFNSFFFETAVRFILQKVKVKSSVEVTYSSVEGNLFTGTVRFRDARISRTGSSKSNFKFKADSLLLDLELSSVFSPVRRIESLIIESLEGNFERL